MMAAIVLWSFAAGVESGFVAVSLKILWSKIEYIGLVQIPPLLLIFALQYNHQEKYLSRRRVALLWAVPLAALGLVWTNELHGLVWSGFSPGSPQANILIYHHGLGFYIFQAYLYLLCLTAGMIFIRAMFLSGRPFRYQAAAIVAAVFFPALGGVLYIFNWNPLPGLDWSPMGAAASGLILTWGLHSLSLFDLVPLARGKIFELMQDAAVIVDPRGRLMDVNPTAQPLVGHPDDVIGKSYIEIPLLRELAASFSIATSPGSASALLGEHPQERVTLALPGQAPRHFQVRVSPLRDAQNRLDGYVILTQEITALHRAEEEKRIHREQKQMLIDLAPFRVAYLDSEGHYLLVNRIYAAFFGKDQAEFTGKLVRDALPARYLAQTEPFFHRAMQGEAVHTEVEWPDPDGVLHVEQVNYTPFFTNDGSVDSVGIYALDITGQRRKESDLIRNQLNLERELSERTNTLRQTIAELEREIDQREQAKAELREMEEHLVERVTSQSRKLASLYEVIIAGGQAEETSQLLTHVLERVLASVESQAVCIHECSEKGLRLVAQHGLPETVLSQIGLLPAEWIDTRELPLLVTDLSAARQLPESIRGSGYQAYMAAAIRQRGRAVSAVLEFFWQAPREFSIEDISLASAIGEELGVILENIDLRQRIETAVTLKERRRLARDLHDSVTQSLHSLVLTAFAAKNRLQQGNLERVETTLTQLSQGAQQALKEMRLLLYEMRLVPLQEVDLIEALHTRLEMVESRAGIQAQLQVDPNSAWPKAWEGDLFCIAIEALNNSLKYAQASQVTVSLCGTPSDLHLEIQDNGSGFDPAKSSAGGMGLKNMGERAERLGGQLMVASNPGSGTRILFRGGG